jgi:hypothetical protein
LKKEGSRKRRRLKTRSRTEASKSFARLLKRFSRKEGQQGHHATASHRVAERPRKMFYAKREGQ